MEDKLNKILEQQQIIISQQEKIFESVKRLEENHEILNFVTKRQNEELNARLEINERALRQIDEQIAISNSFRENELNVIKTFLEEEKSLEEFLKLELVARLMDNVEGGCK